MRKRLISSSVYRAIESVWAAGVMLVVTPLLIKTLGTASYGLWLLLLSGIGLMSFFELGFASAIQRRMAQAIEHHDAGLLNRLYSSAVCLFSILSLLALAALSLLVLFPEWLGVAASHQSLATIAFLLFSVKILLDFIANAIHGIFSGQLRFDLDSQISILTMTAKALLMVALVESYGVIGLVVITILADSIAHIAKFVLAYRIQPGLQLQWPVQFRRDCAELFGYARHVVFIDLAKLLQEKSVLILISHLLNLAAISIYAIADRLLRQATMLVQTVTSVLQPYLIRKIEQGQLSVDLMQKTMLLHAWLTTIVLLPIMLCGPAFIMLWVGSEFALSQSLLVIMVFAALLRTIALPVTQFLLARAEHQWIAPLEMTGAIVYIALVLLLGHWYGLQGIVWGSVLSAFIIHTIAFSLLATKTLHIPLRFSLWLTGRLVLLFLLLYATNYHIQLIGIDMSWISLPLWVLACILFAAVLGYYWLLDQAMRKALWGMVLARVKLAYR